jgi:dienelactone hydrolase
MLLAGADRQVSTPACEAVARGQARRGRPLDLYVYAGAGHAFDAEAGARLSEDARNRVQRFLALTMKERK